jgi:hypothetical protein
MRNCRLPIANCRLLAAGVMTLVFCAGCPKRQSTMNRPPQINPPPAVEASAEARVDEMRQLAAQFEETAAQLPGRDAGEHRWIMRRAFAELTQILPILYGPNPAGTFRQQLRVVESSRTQLTDAPKGLAVEPTIDTGLRAARDALEALARQSYFDHSELGQTIDRLTASSAALDTARGVMHQSVVAEVVGLISQAVRQMSDALAQRLGAAPAASAPKPRAPAASPPAGQR